MTRAAADAEAGGRAARVGLFLGPALAVLILILPAPPDMAEVAWRTAACALLMAVWWVTEAIPIPATAALPLALFPVLGVRPIEATAAPYADDVIFLFLGGFLIAIALERCGLHRRIALNVIRAVGTRPTRLIGGFMAATALLSMWVSNTATTIMMLPMATSVIALGALRARAQPGSQDQAVVAQPSMLDPAVIEPAVHSGNDQRQFARALLLGIAYAASIGGLGTLIGTPPNAYMAGFVSQTYGVEIGFAQWMLVGIPVVIIGLPLTWLLLTRVLFKLGDAPHSGGFAVHDELRKLGKPSRAEYTVGIITALTAASWILRGRMSGLVPGLSDAGIAMTGALLMFIIPVARDGERALTWHQAEELPWGVLILFGGGLTLAGAIQESGLATWIGSALEGIGALPIVVVILIVTALIVFLTELTSNAATAAAFLPIVGALAVAIGADPLTLIIPAALAASCAFMLPVATPPNAIVFATGELTVPQMVRAGLWLNLMFIGLLVVIVLLLAGPVFGF